MGNARPVSIGKLVQEFDTFLKRHEGKINVPQSQAITHLLGDLAEQYSHTLKNHHTNRLKVCVPLSVANTVRQRMKKIIRSDGPRKKREA